MKLMFSLFVCLLAFPIFGESQEDNIKWSFDINQVGPQDYELIYRAQISEPWVIYSKDTPEGGPIPLSVNYNSGNVTVIDEGKEEGDRKEGYDNMFDMNVIKYTYNQEYILKQKVRITDISKTVTGYVTFMMCNNEMCLPPRDVDFSFTIRVTNPLEKGDN